MSDQKTHDVIEAILKSLDIPDSAYDKAEKRYKDLGDWFDRPEAECSGYSPHIYPQGSFRLGTVVRPLSQDDDYDLDMGCRLRRGITKATHTQEQLKRMVGNDLEAYRQARKIEAKLAEKHRCWRLNYADEMRFHLDTVPSIPEEAKRTGILMDEMVRAGSAKLLAENVVKHAGAITDDRDPSYRRISSEWRISNSEGYALWFESRVKLAMPLLEKRAFDAKAAKVDDLPARKWKSPLQQVVQLLKRHRDVMFQDDPEGQPISIIITTLAAEAYRGEQEIEDALKRVLTDMGRYIKPSSPRVPNPVNPAEDFADKWSKPEYAHLHLEEKFTVWLTQAQSDFQIIERSKDVKLLTEQAQTKFASAISLKGFEEKWWPNAPAIVTPPKSHNIVETPARPWANI